LVENVSQKPEKFYRELKKNFTALIFSEITENHINIRLKVFGYKWLGCGLAGCNYEVTIQMMIVMVFKPIALNIYHYFLPQIMIWCKKSANTTSTTSLKTEGPRIPEESVLNNNEPTTHFTGSLGARRKRRWEEQNNLLPENPLSYDYIEMVIQEN